MKQTHGADLQAETLNTSRGILAGEWWAYSPQMMRLERVLGSAFFLPLPERFLSILGITPLPERKPDETLP